MEVRLFPRQGVPDKPMVNVEIFGGWTAKFIPPGVYTDEGKQIHIQEIIEAKKDPDFRCTSIRIPGFRGRPLGNRQDLIWGGWGLRMIRGKMVGG